MTIAPHFHNTTHILINTRREAIALQVSDIVYCEAQANYTKFYREKSYPITVSGNLRNYEAKLRDYGFIRTHDEYLVNALHVMQFPYRSLNNKLVLRNGKMLDVSRRKKKAAYMQWKEFIEKVYQMK